MVSSDADIVYHDNALREQNVGVAPQQYAGENAKGSQKARSMGTSF